MLTATGSRLYACNNHGPDHDLFLSYRVATDADTARELKQMLSLAALRRYGKPLAVFHDVDCLVDARDWRDGFLGALPKSKAVILLLSQASMDLMKDKVLSSQEDNVVLEIKTALDLKDANPALPVLPLGIATKETKDGVDVFTPFLPHKVSLPDDPAFASVKETLGRMNQIQMFGIRPDQMHQRVYRILNLLHPVQVDSATKIALYDSLFCDSKFRVDPAHLDTLLKQLTLTGRAVISGMGGMGKSVLALQILHFMMGTLDVSNKDDLKTVKDETIGIKPQYNQVFWINCSTESTALDGLCELFDGVEPEKVKKHAAKFLAKTRGYLLVLDNVDDIGVVDSVFEHSKSVGFSGDVVVTTRLASLPPGAFASAVKAKNPGYRHDPLRLGNWDDTTTLNYILSTSSVFAERIVTEEAREALKRIMTKIDGYPLVIQTFMTFYENNEVPLSEIERLFSKVLEEQDGEDETRSSLKVIVDLSLDSIMKRGNEGIEAARLFGALSLVAPTNIQFELIKEIVQKMELKTDVTDLIKMVIQSGLLRSGAEGLYSTHSLTQFVAREYIQKREELNAEEARRLIGNVLISMTDSLDAKALKFSSHLDTYSAIAIPEEYSSKLHPLLVFRISMLAHGQAQYGKAIHVLLSNLDRIKAFCCTESHPNVAQAYTYLGNAYFSQGDVKAAQRYYQLSLDVYSKIHRSENHRSIVAILGNMGMISYQQGRMNDALQFYQRSLDIASKVYKTREHPIFIHILSGMGSVALFQDRFDDAMQYYQESLSIANTVFKSRNHPQFARTLSEMGDVARAQGRLGDAIEHYQESLDIAVKIYDSRNHPIVSRALNGLGTVARLQLRFNDALVYLQESLDIRYRIYGTHEHPEISTGLLQLGNVNVELKNDDEALRCYWQAYKVATKVYGTDDHHDVAVALDNIGRLEQRRGNRIQARELFSRARDIYQKVYGSAAHPAVVKLTKKLDATLSDTSIGQPDTQ